MKRRRYKIWKNGKNENDFTCPISNFLNDRRHRGIPDITYHQLLKSENDFKFINNDPIIVIHGSLLIYNKNKIAGVLKIY